MAIGDVCSESSCRGKVAHHKAKRCPNCIERAKPVRRDGTDPALITPAEFAARTGRSLGWVRTHTDELPFRRIGSRLLMHQRAYDRFMALEDA